MEDLKSPPKPNTALEIALTLCDAGLIEALGRKGRGAADQLSGLGWGAPPMAALLDGRAFDRLHFGNEFCERLIPDRESLKRALAASEAAGMELALLTPQVGDDGMKRLGSLFQLLPDGTEITVNDWGVLRLLQEDYPGLRPVAGRQLCKMIKDPRLPAPVWTRLSKHGVYSRGFQDLLARFGVGRLELDVPPFAESSDFGPTDMELAVHAPFGYATKGRVCQIGSLHLSGAESFTLHHGCRKQCLTYISDLSRPAPAARTDLHTFQRGNTIFYRHGSTMEQALLAAVQGGSVNRVIFAGDWNENRRTA